MRGLFLTNRAIGALPMAWSHNATPSTEWLWQKTGGGGGASKTPAALLCARRGLLHNQSRSKDYA